MDLFVHISVFLSMMVAIMGFVLVYILYENSGSIILAILTNVHVILVSLASIVYFLAFNRVKLFIKRLLTSRKIKDVELKFIYGTFNKVLPNCYLDVIIEMDKYIEYLTEELIELKQYISMYAYLESDVRGLDVVVKNMAIDQLRGGLVDFIDLVDTKIQILKSGQSQLAQVQSEEIVLELNKEFLEKKDEN